MASKTNKGSSPQLWGRIGKELNIDVDSVLRSNPTLVLAILEMLREFEDVETTKEVSSTDYDSPSWSFKQADRNGARRVLRKIESLFSYIRD